MDNQRIIHGKYRIQRPLGPEQEGITGSVFLASDVRTDEKVAIKILRPIFSSDARLISQLRNAISRMRACRHPGIVRYREIITTGEEIAIVSDYVEGQTLEELLAKAGPLSPQQVKQYMLELCSALHLSHSYGVGHYDLTRRNVMISDSKEVRICDFATSRILKDWLIQRHGVKRRKQREAEHLTQYLAPEQRGSQPRYTIACDIYAAGLLLHEMQTGKYPETAPDSTVSADLEPYTPTTGAEPTQAKRRPEGWDYITQKALSPEPWQRWESFAIMSYALEGKVLTKAKMTAQGTPAIKPSRHLLPKRLLGFALIALILLAAIAGVVRLVTALKGKIPPPGKALVGYLSSQTTPKTRKKKATAPQPQLPRPDMSAYLSKAKELMQQGNLDEAQKQVQKGLALLSKDQSALQLLEEIQKRRTVDSLIKRAKEHLQASQLVEALALVEQALLLDPQNAELKEISTSINRQRQVASLLKEAADAFQSRFYTTPKEKSAYKLCLQVLELDPNNQRAKSIIADIVAAYRRLADELWDRNEFGTALTFYNRMLQVDPGSAYAARRARQCRQRLAASPKTGPEATGSTQSPPAPR